MTRLAASLLAIVAALVALVAFTPDAQAARFTPPPLRGHVVDGTNTLTAEQIAQLDARLTAVRERTGFAVVAFVAPSLEGLPIDDVAYDTFNTWEVGEKGKDNGVLLVIAPNERRVRIETGKGVGGELTDIESAEILRSYVSPAMKDGDLYRAIDQGTSAITEALTGDLPVDERKQPGAGEPAPRTGIPPLYLLGAVIALGLLAIVSPGFRWVLFGLLHSLLSARGGGGGGFGGGGGGYSGGGGRSGGGGASDSY